MIATTGHIRVNRKLSALQLWNGTFITDKRNLQCRFDLGKISRLKVWCPKIIACRTILPRLLFLDGICSALLKTFQNDISLHCRTNKSSHCCHVADLLFLAVLQIDNCGSFCLICFSSRSTKIANISENSLYKNEEPKKFFSNIQNLWVLICAAPKQHQK